MCGVVGLLNQSPVNQAIYDALTIIQHRGQDAAGIMTCDNDRIALRKSHGLVRDAIRESHMIELKGNMGIGHVRYPTAGTQSVLESQPFYVNSPYGIGFVHNGNLINTAELAQDLQQTDLRHLNTHSDSEVLLNVLAYELHRVGGADLAVASIFRAMKSVYQRVSGAFAAIAMICGYGILAFRDPNGIRPLVYGMRETDQGKEYMVASESIALDVLGYELIDDVAPGEVIFIDLNGEVHRQACAKKTALSPCMFEYIYLARPDSVIDHIPVYKARLNMGRSLAAKIQRMRPDHDIDVVIPIPDTSRSAALALAQTLNVDYSEGFVKNRYIGRTFIMPGQRVRRNSVRLKLNAMREEFAGKNVLLVDDSIVRGTTSGEIIQMARDVGARRVYFASAAPEVRYPNVYGIDMPCASELIAHDKSADEVCAAIGADWLIYQALDDARQAILDAAKTVDGSPLHQFETSIFTGMYVTGDVSQPYLDELAALRSDVNQASRKIEAQRYHEQEDFHEH